MIRLFLLLLLSISASAFAADWDLYVDCPNYCAFRDFDNNCHGIAFKRTKNDKNSFFYSHYSPSLKSCVTTRFPYFRAIKLKEVKTKCSCAGMPEIKVPSDRHEPIKESTVAELNKLKAKINKWVPCAPNPSEMDFPNPLTIHYKPSDVRSCSEMESEGKDGYMVLGGCSPARSKHCVYFGNTNYYAGPLCYAGDKDRCEDVAKNQNRETGEWYRSGMEKKYPLASVGQPLFSRDEFLGIMLYMIKTNDKVAALKWMQFIENNPKKPQTGLPFIKVFNICPQLPMSEKPPEMSDADWQTLQPDDRCEMRPDTWGMMYMVYKAMGITDQELKNNAPKVYSRMKAFKSIVTITNNLSVRTVKAVGYELGNLATSILLLREAGLENNAILNNSAAVMNKRTEYDNPYYHYIAEGKGTEYGAYLIKKYCPETQPNYDSPPQGGVGTPSAGFLDMAMHYFGGLTNGWEAELPTGHECVAWINLYTSEAKK